MMIMKTEEEKELIEKFINMMSDLFYTYAFDNPQKDLQSMFDNLKESLYDHAGSIYLCFACGQLLDRKDVLVQQYFQFKRVWHGCQGGNNNMTYPTAGIVTRWKKIIAYIDEKGFFNNEDNNSKD